MARPSFQATELRRRSVKQMAACGITESEMARVLNLKSPKTLRRHFRKELDVGLLESNAKVTQVLVKLATSGKCPAASIFFSKCKMGFYETSVKEFEEKLKAKGSGPKFPELSYSFASDPGKVYTREEFSALPKDERD